MRKLIGVVAGILLVSGTMFTATAGASGTRNYVYASNFSADSSTCGPDWAHDFYTREYKVQKLTNTDGSYRVIETYKGTFSTIAGPSPESCEAGTSNTIANAVAGRFSGFSVLKVSGGSWSPDKTVTCASNCLTALFVSAAFGPSATFTFQDYDFTYKTKTGCAKNWIDAATGDAGDIATACIA